MAMKSSIGLRTFDPRDAANSGCATSARKVALMSVPLDRNRCAKVLTRPADGVSDTKRSASLVAIVRAVAGWCAR